MNIFSDPNFVMFHDTLTSYPVVIYYFFMLLLVCYFFLSMLGVLSVDTIDIDLDFDIAGDTVDVSDLSLLNAILYRFGLFGIPFVFILVFIVFIGLAICFYPSFYFNKLFPSGVMHYILGTGIFLGTLVVSMGITGKILKRLRSKLPQHTAKNANALLGKKAVVRTSRLDDSFGEIVLEDGGAGLILQGRSKDTVFNNADTVVIISYDTANNLYFVISEDTFNKG